MTSNRGEIGEVEGLKFTVLAFQRGESSGAHRHRPLLWYGEIKAVEAKTIQCLRQK
jgi:hypothetical protein